jgi:hypothetical protein
MDSHRGNGDNALLFQTIGLIDRGLHKSGTLNVVITSPLLYFQFRNFTLEWHAFQSQLPYGVSSLGVAC